MKDAETLLEEAERKLINYPSSIILKEQVHDAQSILERHYQRIHESLIIQSRTQFYEEGEKYRQFF